MSQQIQIKRALISVSDKDKLLPLAKALTKFSCEIISTGGTANLLRENQIPYTPIEEVTGNPECFGGRVKTISFEIASSLLFRRHQSTDVLEAQKLNIKAIDLVVCNFYPFEAMKEKIQNLDELIEYIDIGGPSMIRCAAKNYQAVSILSSPTQYPAFLEEMEQNKGKVSEETRRLLALQAFQKTSQYEQVIFSELAQRINEKDFSSQIIELPYGENPHQKAHLEVETSYPYQLTGAELLKGDALSYNNYFDAQAAWSLTSKLFWHDPAKFHTVIIKHQNPCGACSANQMIKSFQYAWKGDPVSAFGSIIGVSHPVDKELANQLNTKFIEVVLAPDFTPDALEILKSKKRLKLLKLALIPKSTQTVEVKSILGAKIFQNSDVLEQETIENKTFIQFPEHLKSLSQFGLNCVEFIKSNAIALVSRTQEGDYWLSGAGGGQPNRLDCLQKLAMPKFLSNTQEEANNYLDETVLVSDAFFPFQDTAEVAKELGLKYLVQPGGSIKDDEVINRCNELKISMAFTGIRHFKH